MRPNSTSASPSAVRWLLDHPNGAPAYARNRILASPAVIGGMLAKCPTTMRERALDAGSGPGYDTFALAEHFSEVLAVDADRGAVRAGRRIARRSGVTNVRFTREDIERVRDLGAADLVWCNVMSHNSQSRVRLLASLVAMLRPGGCLIYAEETEGYALAELARAIGERDLVTVRLRVRQVIAGILGIPRFRFFVAGSAECELSRMGSTVLAHDREAWNGLTTIDRVWALVDGPRSTVVGAGDYTTIDPDLRDVRSRALEYLKMLERDGPVPATRMLRAASTAAGNRLAPLLLVFELASLLPRGLRADRVGFGRARSRLARPVDWPRVGAVHDRLVALPRAADGAGSLPEAIDEH